MIHPDIGRPSVRYWEKQTFRPDLILACPGLCHHPPVMEELLRASIPPDEELADLIETAFLEGQIDGETQSLAFAILRSFGQVWPSKFN